jgi:hypothetical protein
MSFSTTKLSTLLWHGRLGHPSFKIVSRVLHNHELPFVSNKASEAHVCDACQIAKSHQLPFPHSTSESKAPLELIFLMSGVLPPPPLVTKIIMSPLLMIMVSSCGFIY